MHLKSILIVLYDGLGGNYNVRVVDNKTGRPTIVFDCWPGPGARNDVPVQTTRWLNMGFLTAEECGNIEVSVKNVVTDNISATSYEKNTVVCIWGGAYKGFPDGIFDDPNIINE